MIKFFSILFLIIAFVCSCAVSSFLFLDGHWVFGLLSLVPFTDILLTVIKSDGKSMGCYKGF
jgi:hypothetical protein